MRARIATEEPADGEARFMLIEMPAVITIIGLIMGLVSARALIYLAESKVKTARMSCGGSIALARAAVAYHVPVKWADRRCAAGSARPGVAVRQLLAGRLDLTPR